MEKVMAKFVNVYYSYRKTQAQIKSQLSNKLMLYVADSIDKLINSNLFGRLIVLKSLLQKVYRRFSK